MMRRCDFDAERWERKAKPEDTETAKKQQSAKSSLAICTRRGRGSREAFLRFPEWPSSRGAVPEIRPIDGGSRAPVRRECPAFRGLPRRGAYSARQRRGRPGRFGGCPGFSQRIAHFHRWRWILPPSRSCFPARLPAEAVPAWRPRKGDCCRLAGRRTRGPARAQSACIPTRHTRTARQFRNPLADKGAHRAAEIRRRKRRRWLATRVAGETAEPDIAPPTAVTAATRQAARR